MQVVHQKAKGTRAHMFNALSKIPAQHQKAVAVGLLPVAGFAAFFGLVLTGLGIAGAKLSRSAMAT